MQTEKLTLACIHRANQISDCVVYIYSLSVYLNVIEADPPALRAHAVVSLGE